MYNVNIIFGLSLILLGFLITFVSFPLLRHKIKPNRLFGFGFKNACKNDSNWYQVNNFGSKQFIIWSSVIIAAGVITLFLPEISINIFWICWFTIPLVCYTIAFVNTMIFDRKL